LKKKQPQSEKKEIIRHNLIADTPVRELKKGTEELFIPTKDSGLVNALENQQEEIDPVIEKMKASIKAKKVEREKKRKINLEE